MNVWQIDQLVPISYPRGFAVCQGGHVTFEIRRSLHGEVSGLWVDAAHQCIRWSRFALLWATLGAQFTAARAVETP
jgi:hypothetical protein